MTFYLSAVDRVSFNCTKIISKSINICRCPTALFSRFEKLSEYSGCHGKLNAVNEGFHRNDTPKNRQLISINIYHICVNFIILNFHFLGCCLYKRLSSGTQGSAHDNNLFSLVIVLSAENRTVCKKFTSKVPLVL